MANLAIQGHSTRGSEVIALLEMLGGINTAHFKGEKTELAYYIEVDRSICCIDIETEYHTEFYKITIEDFLEKFPYKVGDKVSIPEYESEVRIDDMEWDGFEIQYLVFTDETEWYSTEELNKYNEPYKEETMKEIKIDIPNGYEFAGIDDDKQQVVFTKIGYRYPKTYEECCEVLGLKDSIIEGCLGYEYKLLNAFQKLLMCRDAYWKIAGDWEPDWNNISDKHCIYVVGGEIWLKECQTRKCNLAFPTKEMRDAFYENFKELIEQCKELL